MCILCGFISALLRWSPDRIRTCGLLLRRLIRPVGLQWGIPATGVLVETLLDRGTDSDVAGAEAAVERLAAAPADDGLVIRETWLLRSRALLAHAHNDEAAYRDYRDRYRAMAKTLDFEGHIAWAEAMP